MTPYGIAGGFGGGAAGAGLGQSSSLLDLLSPLDYPRQSVYNLGRGARNVLSGDVSWEDLLRAAPSLAGGGLGFLAGGPLGAAAGAGLAQGLGRAIDPELFDAPTPGDLVGELGGDPENPWQTIPAAIATDPLTYAGMGFGARAGGRLGARLSAPATSELSVGQGLAPIAESALPSAMRPVRPPPAQYPAGLAQPQGLRPPGIGQAEFERLALQQVPPGPRGPVGYGGPATAAEEAPWRAYWEGKPHNTDMTARLTGRSDLDRLAGQHGLDEFGQRSASRRAFEQSMQAQQRPRGGQPIGDDRDFLEMRNAFAQANDIEEDLVRGLISPAEAQAMRARMIDSTSFQAGGLAEPDLWAGDLLRNEMAGLESLEPDVVTAMLRNLAPDYGNLARSRQASLLAGEEAQYTRDVMRELARGRNMDVVARRAQDFPAAADFAVDRLRRAAEAGVIPPRTSLQRTELNDLVQLLQMKRPRTAEMPVEFAPGLDITGGF